MKGEIKMRKFTVYGKQGDKVELTLGNLLTKKYDMPRFEVMEIKKNQSVIIADTTCIITFTAMSNKVILSIKNGGELDISKQQELIDWLYKESKFNILYIYTTEYKVNYED